ncbi:glycosyltransferase family 2 protein [Paenibacillus sp. MMS20-IR301]|uniref:glycosyltransferase family 2 protein n=1 Tax=Paenibacillus sp. MMS20-IR301 TaxID=2895946 RepID=UPI0028E5BC81|nr:glycosyltransferase family 2 protein [Paenibacillus sp. MMS20-IR301]WNS41983.1 glycosyltransferase family 2 protein [Paenibacillus sp. MMS20-IR301]
MDHSRDLQEAGRQLLHQLSDDIHHPPAGGLTREELIRRSRQISSTTGAAIKEQLDTLTGVLDAFLAGRASEDALRFYTSTQYKINVNELAGFMPGLRALSGGAAADDFADAGKILSTADPSPCPKISVIITTYNRQAFLKQAVDSILQQDYPRVEVTVIDDCSSDGTEEMMASAFGGEPRVIFMRNRVNSGPGNNRRKALAAHGDGQFILFLDDDDYLIDRSYLSKAVLAHQTHPGLSFVAANVFLEYSRSQKLTLSSLGLNPVTDKHDYFMNFEQQGYPKPASTLTALFSREALMSIDILNMKMVNDASIYLRALLTGDAGFIDTLAGVYRIHGNNITFNLSQSFLIENLEEKRNIRNMATQRYGYSKPEMSEWFNHNVYDTISYYLMNSAQSHTDFKFMYSWASMHAPEAYTRLKRQFRTKLMKKQLLRVSFVRALLNR